MWETFWNLNQFIETTGGIIERPDDVWSVSKIIIKYFVLHIYIYTHKISKTFLHGIFNYARLARYS